MDTRSLTSTLVVPAALLALSLGVAACGHAKASNDPKQALVTNRTGTRVARREPPTDSDEDNDNLTSSHYDADDAVVLQFGQSPDAATRRAIVSVVKRYQLAAAAGDGAAACSLIYTPVAETAPEAVGATRSGETCATAMSGFFKVNHRHLAADLASFRVTVVRVAGGAGIVLARLGAGERRVLVHRDGKEWRVKTLTAMGVP